MGTTPPPVGVPQIRKPDWDYINDYYDGPLSGMVRVPNGEFIAGEPVFVLHWAECFEENDESDDSIWYRRYQVWELTRESAMEQYRRQYLFEKYVGVHWNGSHFNAEGLKPQSEWHKFYDQAAEWEVWVPEGKVIGWFEI